MIRANIVFGIFLMSTIQAGAADYLANGYPNNLVGTPGPDNFLIDRRAYIPGDVYDGGAGYDTLWITHTMRNIDYPAKDFDFRSAKLKSIDSIAFNYMLMSMPGNILFESNQFGAGLIAPNLKVYGAWGDQDITVYLSVGNTSINASMWSFPTDRISYGAVWGSYQYGGREVGGLDTIHFIGSNGNNNITATVKADIIEGGLGADVIKSGEGKDVIVYRSINDSPNGKYFDTILDFKNGEDKLDFSKFDSNPRVPGIQSLKYEKLVFKNKYLTLDANNDNIIDFVIYLPGVNKLQRTDFNF